MSATLVVLMQVVVAQAAADAAPAPVPAAAEQRSVCLSVAAQLGLPHVLGLSGRATLLCDGQPRFEGDVQWEPSFFLQSYSLGAAWRPAGSIFYVGPRVRLVQFHPPFTRGLVGTDNFLGLGAEAGARIGLTADQRLQLTAGLQATWVPAQAANLQLMFGLNVGVSWAFGEFSW